MGVFDKLQQNLSQQAAMANQTKQTFTFSALPETLAQLQALP